MSAMCMHDFHTYQNGAMLGLDAKSNEGATWLEDNVESNGYQWLGPVLWIDIRFAADLVSGAEKDGLSFKHMGAL